MDKHNRVAQTNVNSFKTPYLSTPAEFDPEEFSGENLVRKIIVCIGVSIPPSKKPSPSFLPSPPPPPSSYLQAVEAPSF